MIIDLVIQLHTCFIQHNSTNMPNFRKLLPMALIALTSTGMSAQVYQATSTGNLPADNEAVPERAIILSGGQNGIHRDVMAVLYDTNEIHFQDPSAPRFLLIDRQGNTVFGIGGYVEGVALYDFGGEIDSYSFAPADIPVPSNPAMRSRFDGNMTHTNIFFQLLRNTKLGVLQAYIQANFQNPNYGMKLKKAYIRLGHVTFGLSRSTFEDALAGPPTIDYQGPAGAVSASNVLIQYKGNPTAHFGWAISAEVPKAAYQISGALNRAIDQRVPDIPAYVQYQWDGGKSHVRASAIFRSLSYRDLVDNKNKLRNGWGVQLSGAIKCGGLASIFYQANYGKGIGHYINDLSEIDVDLIPDGTSGKMKAPASMGITGGIRLNLASNLFLSSSYSLSRLYDQEELGGDAYRRGNYAVVNAFYTPISDLQFGLEYLHGRRTNMDHSDSGANRVQAMIKYSF